MARAVAWSVATRAGARVAGAVATGTRAHRKTRRLDASATLEPLPATRLGTHDSDTQPNCETCSPRRRFARMARPAKRRSFVISLDEPPETRWREVLRTFKSQITAMLVASEDLQAFDDLGPSARFACRQLLLALPEEQRREVRSAAEELGIDLHVAAASQILYEAAVFGEHLEALASAEEEGEAEGSGVAAPRTRIGCTAVAIDCSDIPVHARTLDWMMAGALAPVADPQ